MGRRTRAMGGLAAGHARRQVPARGPSRMLAMCIVAAFGIAAGSVLGTVLYRTVFKQPAATAMSLLDVAPAAIAAEKPVETSLAPKPERQPTLAKTAGAVPDLAWSLDGGVGTSDAGGQKPVPAAATPKPVEWTPDARFARQATDTKLSGRTADPARFETAFAQPVLAGTLTDSREPLDAARTGSIIPPAAIVEFAETEAEIVEMESKLTALGAEHFKVPQQSTVAADPERPAAVEAPAAPQPGFVNAKTRKWVNLRAAPNNKSKVLAVVPAKADILADEDCTRWCGVVYEGQKGFIYRTFIRRAERSSKPVEVASASAATFAADSAFEATSVSAYAAADAEAENMGYKKGGARKSVNLRSGPSGKSEVLTIVPADAEIMVETDCKWCGAVYKGQKGYIYNTFVMYADENNG